MAHRDDEKMPGDTGDGPARSEMCRIVEIMFDVFGVPALYIGSKCALELRDACRRVGLVVHLVSAGDEAYVTCGSACLSLVSHCVYRCVAQGHGTTLATPVYSLSELTYAVQSGTVTGNVLTGEWVAVVI